MKILPCPKRLSKEDKEHAILFGLIELYIKTGEPVGSNSLKENGFEHISSATIRNYFSKLEEKGLLAQQHISGGRVPTPKAIACYADDIYHTMQLKNDPIIAKELNVETNEISSYLSSSAEMLSKHTNCLIFQSFPKFDQDFIKDLKIIMIDEKKLLAIIITDFGMVKTETLFFQKNLSDKDVKFIEEFLLYKLQKKEKPAYNNHAIINLAQHFYNEIMVRFVADYSSESKETIYVTGLANLLAYKEFNDLPLLANILSFLEDDNKLKSVLKKNYEKNSLSFFLGQDLKNLIGIEDELVIISVPYYVNQLMVGSAAIVAPLRINYKKLFNILINYSQIISKNLTDSIYKYRITFQQPRDAQKINHKHSILLEDKTKKN